VWHVYIVRCRDNSLYVGETNDVNRRLAKHNDGRASTYTATRRPLTVVYLERHANREQALRREKQLKGWSRAKKEAWILTDQALLKRL
jgi:predicted GIY-YIG superfamily endonuclease